jgi:predicted PurR-regulated permease PerM
VSRGVDRLSWALVAGLCLIALWLLADVMLMIFAAALLAVGYRSSAAWLARTAHLPIGASLTLVGVGAAAILAATLWWGGTGLADQAGELWTQLQDEGTAIRGHLQGTAWGRHILHDLGTERGFGRIDSLAGQFAGAALTTFGVIGSVLIVSITAVYLAVSPELYRDGALKLLPAHYRRRGAEVLDEVGETLKSWLIGRAIDMAVVVSVTFVGLLLLGVPLALVLAIIAGTLNFVPYIGAFAGAVPAVLVAFGQGPTQALWVGLLFLAIQMFEGYLLAPQIQERTVRLPPALTIFSQTVFGTLFGLLGLLLAPALAAALLVVVRMVYVGDVLGDGPAVRE